MDEADCFGPQQDYVGGNRSLALPVPGQDESFMYERVKNEKGTLNNCNNNLESSFPGEIGTKPFENALSASFPSLTSTTATKAQEKTLSPTPKDEGYCESPSIHGDGSCQHHIDYEKSRRETQCGDLSSTKEFDSQINLSNTAISSSDCSIMRYHRDELPSSIGTDETDQGRVVPNFSLTEHPTALSNSQYYPKPIDSAGLKFVSDPKLKESPGLSCQPTAISHNYMGHHEESPSAIYHQCASASSTLQGGLASNSKPFGSSNKPVEGEVGKRKTSCDEQIEEDQTLRMKRQKMSTNIQQEVQYNQTVLSPTQYQVSGKGNLIFDSPNNCTFHLHKGGQEKQHALQWASRQSSQTDSATSSIPTESLQTVAKLIAQTTEWKKIARLLPMTECPTLESDIKSLEECQGTTSDKTLAVLTRWWREHPEQGDRTTMLDCLQQGLECCKLVRLARSVDKYFPSTV
ncbi:uncharacterized protein [Asterias amurensis]|uniref:uncharacterized protein n=1 Tax=Asterias amurensis TaxID=7602 RepID=UPI003AB7906C